MSVCQVCAWKKARRSHTHAVSSPLKTAAWIMKYSQRHRPSDCQHGHLTNFTETHLKSERSGPPSEQQSGGYCCPACLSVYCYYYFNSKERSERPREFSAVKCAHVGDARCVSFPTDRQTHPAASPASPLLHPSTSVTLTVRAHLSISRSNCSPRWRSFLRDA